MSLCMYHSGYNPHFNGEDEEDEDGWKEEEQEMKA
jgi:hypothetical protein